MVFFEGGSHFCKCDKRDFLFLFKVYNPRGRISPSIVPSKSPPINPGATGGNKTGGGGGGGPAADAPPSKPTKPTKPSTVLVYKGKEYYSEVDVKNAIAANIAGSKAVQEIIRKQSGGGGSAETTLYVKEGSVYTEDEIKEVLRKETEAQVQPIIAVQKPSPEPSVPGVTEPVKPISGPVLPSAFTDKPFEVTKPMSVREEVVRPEVKKFGDDDSFDPGMAEPSFSEKAQGFTHGYLRGGGIRGAAFRLVGGLLPVWEEKLGVKTASLIAEKEGAIREEKFWKAQGLGLAGLGLGAVKGTVGGLSALVSPGKAVVGTVLAVRDYKDVGAALGKKMARGDVSVAGEIGSQAVLGKGFGWVAKRGAVGVTKATYPKFRGDIEVVPAQTIPTTAEKLVSQKAYEPGLFYHVTGATPFELFEKGKSAFRSLFSKDQQSFIVKEPELKFMGGERRYFKETSFYFSKEKPLAGYGYSAMEGGAAAPTESYMILELAGKPVRYSGGVERVAKVGGVVGRGERVSARFRAGAETKGGGFGVLRPGPRSVTWPGMVEEEFVVRPGTEFFREREVVPLLPELAYDPYVDSFKRVVRISEKSGGVRRGGLFGSQKAFFRDLFGGKKSDVSVEGGLLGLSEKQMGGLPRREVIGSLRRSPSLPLRSPVSPVSRLGDFFVSRGNALLGREVSRPVVRDVVVPGRLVAVGLRDVSPVLRGRGGGRDSGLSFRGGPDIMRGVPDITRGSSMGRVGRTPDVPARGVPDITRGSDISRVSSFGGGGSGTGKKKRFRDDLGGKRLKLDVELRGRGFRYTPTLLGLSSGRFLRKGPKSSEVWSGGEVRLPTLDMGKWGKL